MILGRFPPFRADGNHLWREEMTENPQGDQTAVEAVQIPCELPFIYRGDLERRYRVKAARRGERVCFLNLDHQTVPHWLWVNEVMFTEFGIRIPFTDFQQRLLNRELVAPSQLHPNAWSSIHCFELVTGFLELPQDSEVFLFLFKFYSSNTSGKTKKGYISVRLAKYHKLFGLYEDSFHDFKGRYFKIFPVGTHRPFWSSLQGDGQFPPYWSDQAGFEIVPVTYERLNADQKDIADILTHLFTKNNLAPKSLLGNQEEARKAIVEMVGNDVTLSRLRRLVCPALSGLPPSASGVVSVGKARATSATSAGKAQVERTAEARVMSSAKPSGWLRYFLQ
ncbi:hypothetical protein PIB30_062286 [Stylosanthes scabra]|uniref:Uncharacterized protein n=1 Tax=Stylosanthes scabra TaxID=79078 RepID=A0ABU6TKU7_9FABA|nr:hypothetical protein [Stylosanthes scabra]